MLVSVVIPTIGRDSLARAVSSVREQRSIATQLLVICDSPAVPKAVLRLQSSIDHLVCTGGGRGGSYSRNLGVELSSGDYVAFLDDDDYWSRDKLEAQVVEAQRLQTLGYAPVVASRVTQIKAHRLSHGPDPTTLIGDGESPEAYLFKGRTFGLGRPLIPTSTLLTSQTIARAVRWDESLSRHQDWDWLIRAAREEAVRVTQIPDAAVTYTVGSPKSLSARVDWRPSYNWAQRYRGDWPNKLYVNFLFSHVIRFALQSRDWVAATKLLCETVRLGMPARGSLVACLAGLLSRRTMENAAFVASGVRVGAGESSNA